MSAVLLGAVCVVKLMLIDNLIFGYDYTWVTSIVVGVALASTVLISKLVGCMLPFFAKMVKLDPAVVASPFITTIIDVLSLLLFVFFATVILM